MDEPFGALDTLTREHMQDELRLIHGQTGCTAVLVTHSVEEAVYPRVPGAASPLRVVVMTPTPSRTIPATPAIPGDEPGTRAIVTTSGIVT
jgi:nitrate/nitrite transport system ATP-binding protein